MIVDPNGFIDIAASEKGSLDDGPYVAFVRATPDATRVLASSSLGFGYGVRLASDRNGNLYAVWNSEFSGAPLDFSRSFDGGETFSAPQPIATSATAQHIAADANGTIFVVWTNGTISLTRSTDGGNTFSTPAPISDATKTASSPLLAVTPKGTVTVLWQYSDGSRCDIWSRSSSDAGESFSQAVNVSKSSACASLAGVDCCTWGVNYEDDHQMQVDSQGDINLVWDDSSLGVMFCRSVDGGATFSAPMRISDVQGVWPKVAVDSSGKINVAWDQASGTGGFLFSRSTDGGATFSSPRTIGSDESANPEIGTDSSGDIDIVWQEPSTIAGNGLVFSQSIDQGQDFSPPILIQIDGLADIPEVQFIVEPDGSVDVIGSNTIDTPEWPIGFSRHGSPIVGNAVASEGLFPDSTMR
jgi:hypothetical protein